MVSGEEHWRTDEPELQFQKKKPSTSIEPLITTTTGVVAKIL
jgi:hypothetical protein